MVSKNLQEFRKWSKNSLLLILGFTEVYEAPNWIAPTDHLVHDGQDDFLVRLAFLILESLAQVFETSEDGLPTEMVGAKPSYYQVAQAVDRISRSQYLSQFSDCSRHAVSISPAKWTVYSQVRPERSVSTSRNLAQ